MSTNITQKKKCVPFAIGMLCCSIGFGANGPATEQDLQHMFDQKEYRTCLQQTARVLNIQGNDAKAYDRLTLQMRRGECFLNLDDPATAIIAFNAALSAAQTPQKAEQARAMVVLIKASRGGVYTPRSAPNTPINIVPLATRQDAMKALFADQFAASAGDIKAALEATSLVPIIQFVPQAQNLHALEMAGFGNDNQSHPVLLAIGARARAAITDQLKVLNTQIDGIQNRANQLVASGYAPITTVNGTEYLVPDTRVGLSADDRDALRNMLPYLSDIMNVSVRGKQVAQSIGADGLVWNPIIAEADRLLRRAQSVLDAE